MYQMRTKDVVEQLYELTEMPFPPFSIPNEFETGIRILAERQIGNALLIAAETREDVAFIEFISEGDPDIPKWYEAKRKSIAQAE